MINYGPQTGDSLYLNLPWFHFFAEEVLAGTPYPRWLTDMSAGAGSPVFFFYGAIPFYFTTLAAALFSEASEGVQLGIGQYLIVLSSAITFYIFIRQHCAVMIAALGALLYALAPYHFEMDLLFRQAIGEVTTFVWLPLIFLGIERLQTHCSALPLLAISYGLLVMTHLPTALLCSPFFLIYCLVHYAYGKQIMHLGRFALGILLGLSLSACYLLPALLMQQYIAVEYLWINYFDYHRWFFLDGQVAPNSGDEARLFAIAVGNSVLFLLSWPLLYWISGRTPRPLVIMLMLSFLGAWFLMTPLSGPLWHYLPVLQKVQFPWRVMVLQEFTVVTTVILTFSHSLAGRRGLRYLIAGAIAASMLVWVGYRAVGGYQEHLQLADDPASQRSQHAQAVAGRGAKEYIPASVKTTRRDFLEKMSTLDQLVFDRRFGHIKVIEWQNRRVVLDADLKMSTAVAVKQVYFPGWEVAVDDRLLQITPTRRFGLIRFEAPAGRNRIELVLRPLWPERLGWVLSAAGLLVIVLVAAIGSLGRR